jgi:hypothetical protein
MSRIICLQQVFGAGICRRQKKIKFTVRGKAAPDASYQQGLFPVTGGTMIIFLRILLTVGVAAVACEQLVPASRVVLPLGGSELAQLGVMLVVIAVAAEIRAWLHSRRARRRRAELADSRGQRGQ